MIGRYYANLTGIVAAIAGGPMRFDTVLYDDQLKQSPSNITGFTGRCTLLDANGSVLVAANSGNSGVQIDGSGGVITVNSAAISPAHTAIPAGTHQYALELYNDGGELELYVTGEWLFDEDLSP